MMSNYEYKEMSRIETEHKGGDFNAVPIVLPEGEGTARPRTDCGGVKSAPQCLYLSATAMHDRAPTRKALKHAARMNSVGVNKTLPLCDARFHSNAQKGSDPVFSKIILRKQTQVLRMGQTAESRAAESQLDTRNRHGFDYLRDHNKPKFQKRRHKSSLSGTHGEWTMSDDVDSSSNLHTKIVEPPRLTKYTDTQFTTLINFLEQKGPMTIQDLTYSIW